jgi:FkbM family methyltransferase
VKARGDLTLRQDYPLNSESVVLDVGGYHGDWAEKIATKFDSKVYIFEAAPLFADQIRKRLCSNHKVNVYSYGLADADGQEKLFLDADSSSRFRGTAHVNVSFRDVDIALSEIGLKQIDLIKINIEGGEFPLLRRMLETGWVDRCRYLQIQFHEFVSDARSQRMWLRERLSETHDEMWNYEFVWESWKRKGAS